MKLKQLFGSAVASLTLSSGAAWATTIDFQALEVVGFGNTSAGAEYAEDGFILTALGGSPPHFQFFETMEPRYPGSTALFFGQPDMSARLEAASSLPFDILSIDLALIGGGGGFVAFTGLLATGGQVVREFVVPTGDVELVTFYFSGFNGLVALTWVEEFHLGHQFDNIVVRAAPEPCAMLLVAIGLGVLVLHRVPPNTALQQARRLFGSVAGVAASEQHHSGVR